MVISMSRKLGMRGASARKEYCNPVERGSSKFRLSSYTREFEAVLRLDQRGDLLSPSYPRTSC